MFSSSKVLRASSLETSTSCNFSPGRIPMASSWQLGAIDSTRSARRNLRDKNLASPHLLDTTNDKTDSLFESHTEARHPSIRDSDFASLTLFKKYGNHAARGCPGHF